MKYTQIPETAFQELQLNAGVLLGDFDPATGEVAAENILGATSGGVSFTATPVFSDLGEDMDNCPKNLKELKRLDAWEVKLAGTYVTVNPAQVRSLLGAADAAGTSITPRSSLEAGDFAQLWWVGDYADGGGNGFVAVQMKNTLSTGGFQLQTGDKAKGQFAFEYTAHYSMEDPEAAPFAVYIQAGTGEVAK